MLFSFVLLVHPEENAPYFKSATSIFVGDFIFLDKGGYKFSMGADGATSAPLSHGVAGGEGHIF